MQTWSDKTKNDVRHEARKTCGTVSGSKTRGRDHRQRSHRRRLRLPSYLGLHGISAGGVTRICGSQLATMMVCDLSESVRLEDDKGHTNGSRARGEGDWEGSRQGRPCRKALLRCEKEREGSYFPRRAQCGLIGCGRNLPLEWGRSARPSSIAPMSRQRYGSKIMSCKLF